MLPSFYLSPDKPQVWRITRAAIYGAGIGAAAALLKTFVSLHGAVATSDRSIAVLANLPEIAGAAVGFAALCALAAALRNFLARQID
jgi:hypothetical protein